MLFRAYNLCDPGPDREQEIQTLRYAFINQDYPPTDVEQTINNYQECEGNEENKQAENRSESIVVPYIRGISEKLRRDLAKQDVNVVFKRGKTLHSMIFNGKFKKKDGRKKMLYTKYHAEIANRATLVKPLKGTMRENHNFGDVLEIKMKIMASSGILETQGTILLGKMFNF